MEEEKKNAAGDDPQRLPVDINQDRVAAGEETAQEASAEDASGEEVAVEEVISEEVVVKAEGNEPPPIPKSVDDEWAEKLGVPNNVPPIPNEQFTMRNAQSGGNAQSLRDAGDAPWRRACYGGRQPKTESSQLTDDSEPMPSTWLVWSVVCTILCCFLPGIVAIIQSSRVSSRYYAGDIEGARRASRNAEIWIIISFVLGVLSSTLYLPMVIAGFR